MLVVLLVSCAAGSGSSRAVWRRPTPCSDDRAESTVEVRRDVDDEAVVGAGRQAGRVRAVDELAEAEQRGRWPRRRRSGRGQRVADGEAAGVVRRAAVVDDDAEVEAGRVTGGRGRRRRLADGQVGRGVDGGRGWSIVVGGVGSSVELVALAVLSISKPSGVDGSTVARDDDVWTWPGVRVPEQSEPVHVPCGIVSSVQVGPVRAGSSASMRMTASASDGPLLVTVMV